ncbi:hypothetical protein TNCV_3840841 [Trichonephila clavipes]|nr:hypothetical protein TNCV_3840841 [Trichonephila clavipes]
MIFSFVEQFLYGWMRKFGLFLSHKKVVGYLKAIAFFQKESYINVPLPRGLLATNRVILKHVQRRTTQLTPSSPNIPTGGRSNLDKLASSTQRNFCGTRLELMTHQPQVCDFDHQATAEEKRNCDLFMSNANMMLILTSFQ